MMKETVFSKLEKLMVAVTFAEAGEHETALKILDCQPANEQSLDCQPANEQSQRIRYIKEEGIQNRPLLMA